MVEGTVWKPFSGDAPPIFPDLTRQANGHLGEFRTSPSSETSSGKKLHNNPWYTQNFGDFQVTEAPLYQCGRKLRVVCSGAGATAIQAAYKITKHFKDVEVVLYEKNNSVGGTWLENRYPGCACDIPSHAYQFSWNRNPEWSSL